MEPLSNPRFGFDSRIDHSGVSLHFCPENIGSTGFIVSVQASKALGASGGTRIIGRRCKRAPAAYGAHEARQRCTGSGCPNCRRVSTRQAASRFRFWIE